MSSLSSNFLKLDSSYSSSSLIASLVSLTSSIMAVKAMDFSTWPMSSESLSGLVSLKVVTRALFLPIDLRYVGHSWFV